MHSPTRGVIRTTLALLAATVLTAASGCPTSSTEPKQTPLDCAKGYYQVGNACQPRPDLVTIVISSTQVSTNLSGFCPTFTPNPASVKVNQDFRFQNLSGKTLTIMGWGASPWVTVAPGEYSSAMSFTSSGRVLHTVSGCSATQSVGQNYYGGIYVTIA